MDFSKHLAKAAEAARRKNYDFAVELYRQLLDLDQDLEEARAGLRVALKKRAEAKGGGWLLRALGGAVPLGKAKSLAKLGKHEAAAKALEDYLGKNPLDVAANLALGSALEQAGHLRSAKAVFQFVAEIAPTNPEGLKRAGEMLMAAGDHAAALEHYERALAIDPRDQDAIKARKNLAAEAALSGSRLDSVGHSRELAAKPDELAQSERARRMHRTEEELGQDLTRLEGRFAEAPSDVDLMLEMAEVHEKLGDAEAAYDLVDRACQYRRDDPALAERRGGLELRMKRRQLAAAGKSGDEAGANRIEAEIIELELAEFARRAAARPGDGDLAVQFGRRLLDAGRAVEALAELQRVAADYPGAGELAFAKSSAYRALGHADLAAKELERASAALAPTSQMGKEVGYLRGALAEEAGDREAARTHYLSVFEVDLGFRDVAAKLEQLKS